MDAADMPTANDCVNLTVCSVDDVSKLIIDYIQKKNICTTLLFLKSLFVKIFSIINIGESKDNRIQHANSRGDQC